jgi:hypothetical protein
MATMMPSDIAEFETEGEKAFYKFLEAVAKPDQVCGVIRSIGLSDSLSH